MRFSRGISFLAPPFLVHNAQPRALATVADRQLVAAKVHRLWLGCWRRSAIPQRQKLQDQNYKDIVLMKYCAND